MRTRPRGVRSSFLAVAWAAAIASSTGPELGPSQALPIAATLFTAVAGTPPPSASPVPVFTVPAPEDPELALLDAADWELLADMVGAGWPGTIWVATDHSEFITQYTRNYPASVVPETQLDDPVYVNFNLEVQLHCPAASIDALVAHSGLGLVFGQFTRRPGRTNCGDIAGDHTFVVAIRPSALPTGWLTFRIERGFSRCLGDCEGEREQVLVEMPSGG